MKSMKKSTYLRNLWTQSSSWFSAGRSQVERSRRWGRYPHDPLASGYLCYGLGILVCWYVGHPQSWRRLERGCSGSRHTQNWGQPGPDLQEIMDGVCAEACKFSQAVCDGQMCLCPLLSHVVKTKSSCAQLWLSSLIGRQKLQLDCFKLNIGHFMGH